MFCLSLVPPPRSNPQDKKCHMVASEHPDVIEGRWKLITMDVIHYDDSSEDVSIDNDGDALYEEDESG